MSRALCVPPLFPSLAPPFSLFCASLPLTPLICSSFDTHTHTHSQDAYLGKDQITITLNFSKAAMNVVGQLYQFVRCGGCCVHTCLVVCVGTARVCGTWRAGQDAF